MNYSKAFHSSFSKLIKSSSFSNHFSIFHLFSFKFVCHSEFWYLVLIWLPSFRLEIDMRESLINLSNIRPWNPNWNVWFLVQLRWQFLIVSSSNEIRLRSPTKIGWWSIKYGVSKSTKKLNEIFNIFRSNTKN